MPQPATPSTGKRLPRTPRQKTPQQRTPQQRTPQPRLTAKQRARIASSKDKMGGESGGGKGGAKWRKQSQEFREAMRAWRDGGE